MEKVLRTWISKRSRCVFIGDGKGDLSAARYTKIPFVAIDPDTGEFEGEDGFDGPYKNLAEWGKKRLAQIPRYD